MTRNSFVLSLLIEQVLGDKAFPTYGRYFVSMHFTDNAPPPWKKALSFVFNLPAPDKLEDLTRLVAMIPFYIDLIGRLRLTPQVYCPGRCWVYIVVLRLTPSLPTEAPPRSFVPFVWARSRFCFCLAIVLLVDLVGRSRLSP